MAAPPQWMPAPQVDPNCPKGLEYLTQIDQLVVKQQVELLEAFTDYEGANKYNIFNTLGQQVYFAAEQSNCLERQCCLNARSFEMRIVDNLQAEVMIIKRPLRCTSSCYCCASWRQFMSVESPPGNTIGYIQAELSFVNPSFLILGPNMEPQLRIQAPCFGHGCCTCEPKYKVQTLDEQEIGLIQKKWSGFAKEAFTEADNFSINFPMDLDVKVKAVLMGALFMIDFLYFEKSSHDDDSGGY
ncbi:phospholipid scramblase 1-like [Sycon ciliatum]|uniref:phospholipid scramblase 1-like n=1 Tax=Sycon ciliatum TaxID=27933 RepID=UPI0020AED3BF|eukprot:scpid81171/ scgid19169/ Phospholipid scramblase 1; Ca(2+)-dependent phospholipid scramblase 1; Transplantability-associated protein 1